MFNGWPPKRGKVLTRLHGVTIPTVAGRWLQLPRGPSQPGRWDEMSAGRSGQPRVNRLPHLSESMGCKLHVQRTWLWCTSLFPWGLPASLRREGAAGAHTQCQCRGWYTRSQTMAHAMGSEEVQKWEGSVCVCVGGGQFCVSHCPLQLGTPRGQGPPLPLPSPWSVPVTCSSPKVSRKPFWVP